jgi:hypothetical protein
MKCQNTSIEFNGDYWHCNPNAYDADHVHEIKGQSAKEIWDADAKRLNVFIDIGYSVHVIWETDFSNSDWKTPLTQWVKGETCKRRKS